MAGQKITKKFTRQAGDFHVMLLGGNIMTEKPFCGYPYGFHEFASLPEMPEDECCVHCGRPRREIEATEPNRIKCECNYFEKDYHPNYPNICVACGRPIEGPNDDEAICKSKD